jgi:hypothetical protein
VGGHGNFLVSCAFIMDEGTRMKVLFRAALLLLAFFIALGLVKWLFAKVLILALYVAAIAFIAYIILALLKKA